MTDEIERLLDEQEDGEQDIWAFPEILGGAANRRGRQAPRERPVGRKAGDGPVSGGPERTGQETGERADDGTDTADAWQEALDGTEERTREEKRQEWQIPQSGAEDSTWMGGDAVRRAAGFVRETAEDGRRLPRVGRVTGIRARGAESAQTLYRRLRQAGEAALYRGRAETAAELTPHLPGAGRLSLNELDRAFQRDARRYDSGFELY